MGSAKGGAKRWEKETGSAHSNSSPASATPVAPHTRVGPHAPPSPRGEGFLGAGVDVLRKGIAQPHGRGSLDGEGSHSDPWVTAYLTPLHQHNMQIPRKGREGSDPWVC